MPPSPSLIHAYELRRQELLAEAAKQRLAAQVRPTAGAHPPLAATALDRLGSVLAALGMLLRNTGQAATGGLPGAAARIITTWLTQRGAAVVGQATDGITPAR